MTNCSELFVQKTPGPLPVLLRRPYVPWTPPVTSRRVPQEKRPGTLATSRKVIQEKLPATLPAPPAWTVDPWTPWGGVKWVWRKLNDGDKDGLDWSLLGVSLAGALFLSMRYPWVPPLAVIMIWFGALAYGLSVVWLCARGLVPWRWSTKRAGIATAVLFVYGVALMVRGAMFDVALLSLAAMQAFAYRPLSREETTNWWSEQRLIRNWTDAGIFGARAPELLWFHREVPHREDENGVHSTTVVPMSGPRKNARVVNIGADRVEAARPALERVMGLKIGQLHISHDPEHDAGAITLTVTPPVVRHTVVRAVMPDTWDYNQPLYIGDDPLGRPVYRSTWGRHAGFVAMTQKGKTASVMYDVGHAVLDPNIPIWLFDFKGDDKDFKALRPLCVQSVTGASLENARKALSMLEELEAISESRASLQPEDHGIVVIVDEWFRLLSLCQRLDPALAKKLDHLLTELMATSASRRIKFISLFQGGTSDYINKPMRINIGQRFCGVTESKDEVRYFLETTPPQLPQAPGQFVFKDDGVAPVLVVHPYLDPAAFAEVCARATRLRQPVIEAPDSMESLVLQLLAQKPMKASMILAELPEALRPPGATASAQAQALGYAIKKMPGVVSKQIEGQKHYLLASSR